MRSHCYTTTAISVSLDDDERWREPATTGWGSKKRDIEIEVSWVSGDVRKDDRVEDQHFGIRGAIIKKDGTPGLNTKGVIVPFTDLPLSVRQRIITDVNASRRAHLVIADAPE